MRLSGSFGEDAVNASETAHLKEECTHLRNAELQAMRQGSAALDEVYAMRVECAGLREGLREASSAASVCSSSTALPAETETRRLDESKLVQLLNDAAVGGVELRKCAAREAQLRHEWSEALQVAQSHSWRKEVADGLIQLQEHDEEEALLHLQCAGLRQQLAGSRDSSNACLETEDHEEVVDLRHQNLRLRERLASMSRSRRTLERRVAVLCEQRQMNQEVQVEQQNQVETARGRHSLAATMSSDDESTCDDSLSNLHSHSLDDLEAKVYLLHAKLAKAIEKHKHEKRA